MKKLFRFLVVSLFLAAGLSTISCSDDNKDTYNDSIVGTWEQVMTDYGITAIWQFNSDGTGSHTIISMDGSGSNTENFEYVYYPEDRILRILYTSSTIQYEIAITASKLMMTAPNGDHFVYTRK